MERIIGKQKLHKLCYGGFKRWFVCLTLLFCAVACGEDQPAPTATPRALPTRAALTPIALVTPTPILAANALYVAPTGNDDNPGTQQRPFRTMQHAVDLAQAGDTVYVRQGIYHETVTIKNSGEPNRLLTVAAYPGERPVIDGQYRLPAGEPARWNRDVDPPIYFVWGALVRIRGSYIRFAGFEVKQSAGRAILISNTSTQRNQHVELDDCLVHDSRNSLVRVMSADNVTVQHCEFYHASDYATHSRNASELDWPAAVAAIDANQVVFRQNIVHENWSSGISPGVDSRHITIENNIIYDHLGQQIYVHRSQNVTIRNNLVYHTNQSTFQRFGDPSSCLALNNEVGFDTVNTVSDIRIEQNIFVGCKRNIGIWRSEGSGSPIQNVEIVNNTLVNATSNINDDRAIGFMILPGNFQNIRIERNLILQNQGDLISTADNPEIVYHMNAWSRTPPAVAGSATDIIGDPHLYAPDTILVPGQVQPGWYVPTTASAPELRNLGATYFYQADNAALPRPKAQSRVNTDPTATSYHNLP